jgi:hypothetical protein
VQELFGLKPIEAVKQLNSDLHLVWTWTSRPTYKRCVEEWGECSSDRSA